MHLHYLNVLNTAGLTGCILTGKENEYVYLLHRYQIKNGLALTFCITGGSVCRMFHFARPRLKSILKEFAAFWTGQHVFPTLIFILTLSGTLRLRRIVNSRDSISTILLRDGTLCHALMRGCFDIDLGFSCSLGIMYFLYEQPFYHEIGIIIPLTDLYTEWSSSQIPQT